MFRGWGYFKRVCTRTLEINATHPLVKEVEARAVCLAV